MTDLKAKEITQDQLIRVLQQSKEPNSSLRYGFILGAGASVNSKIPSGSFFAKKWHKEISEDLSKELLEEWEKTLPDFDKNNLAQSYTKIFAKRFEVDYQAGYEELQRYMDKAEPSIGYSFLAQILDETPNKFVITTNFDTMVEDALFGLKKSKPLVLGHELLSKYINPVSPSRPTIVKIHRDFLFAPYNDDEHIQALDTQWEESLTPVLNENAMIVLGYGGNDDSLMNYLKDIKNRKPIYWCYRGDKSTLSSKIKGILTKKDFIVQIRGFDKLMLTINDKLGFENIIDTENIDNSTIVKNALAYAKNYEQQLEDLTKEDLDKEEQTAIKKLLPSWWDYEIQVREENDTKKKEDIYLEGLKAHPESSELMGNYANLLMKLNRDDEAESHYLKILEIEPNDATVNGNFAILLMKLNRGDEAKSHYLKALEIEPNNEHLNGNYAQFLLSKGENEKATPHLENAFKNSIGKNDLLLELWFYRLAHYTDYFMQAKEELDKLLNKGITSIGWDFSKNIEQAKKEDHPNIELLEEYADKITKK